jgi:ADP-ribosyl-[dinitrogen reductase] hydrolase
MGAAYSGVKMKGTADLQSRQKGAILGMFIGDALAMPVHWYYDRQALYRDYGHVTDYQTPRNPHPDSILWRSVYNVGRPIFFTIKEDIGDNMGFITISF